MDDDSDLLIQAGFSTAKMEAETRKLIAKYEDAGKRSAKKFDDAMAKVSNNQALKATAREVDRLARKFDPAYAAGKRWERGVTELKRAVEIGSISHSQYKQELERLAQGLERGGRGARKFGATVSKGGSDVRSYGGALQNVGFQIGDFATQVGAGTSATQALGQQLPQLLGGFGVFGAVAGATAAILVPLTSALYQNLTGAVDLEEQMKALAETTDAYVNAAEAAATPIETLREKYGDLADEIALANRQAAIFAGAAVEVQTERSLEGLTGSFGGLSRSDMVALDSSRGFWANLVDKGPVGLVTEFENTVQVMAKELQISVADATRLAEVFERLESASGVDAQIAALTELNALFLDVAGSPGEVVSVFSDIQAQAQDLLDNLSKQAGASLSEEERRREQILARATERERELARLVADRGIAEREMQEASLAADHERVKVARAAIAGIDAEIDQMTDAEGRMIDLVAQSDQLLATLGRVTLDPENQVYQQAVKLENSIRLAAQNVGDLNDADLSSFETRLRFLTDALESMRAAARGINEDLSIAALGAQEEYGRSRDIGENGRRRAVTSSAIETIKQFEGFRANAYWDVNAYRAGFGSDTVTLADGSVRRITQGMSVTITDANRDLFRRVGEFQDVIVGQIGRDRFAGFTEQQQASLTSVAYNYGSLPERILAAVKGGSNQDIATAIARLESDNGGINSGRRLQEASAFGSTDLVRSEMRQSSDRQRELEKEAKERKRLLDIRLSYQDLMRSQIADAELENQLIGKSAEEQARMRAEYLLTQEAKRRGIDLNERIAGTEETYAEAIKRTAAAMAQQVVVEQQLNSARDAAAEKTEFMTQMQTNLKDGLIDAIVEGKNFADVLSNVAKMLARAAIEAALFGSGPFGGGGSGLLGGLFNGIFRGTGAPSFSGGGFTGTGPRSGGIDGEGGFPAILHPNETVIDHTKQSGVGGVSFSISVDARGADAGAVQRISSALEQFQVEFKPRVIEAMRHAGKRNVQV